MLGFICEMKTTISVPDALFQQAERFARRTKKSRSQLFCEAVREYILRHSQDRVTEAMDRVMDEVGSRGNRFLALAGGCALERTEW